MDFRQKRFRILIATNTLAQGVNLPVRTVIIHSCRRYVDDVWKRIPARDYWNIAGRAGRAGEETEGLIIHIKVNDNDEEDYQYYLKRREDLEPVESALFQHLIDLANGRLTEEALKADLDPEILAIMAEEDPNLSSEDIIHHILDGSLVQLQANQRYSMEQLSRTFVSVADDITQKIADHGLRNVYSSTGLNTNSCKLIGDHVVQNKSSLFDLFLHGQPERLDEIIDLLLPISLELSEMQLEREFSGNYNELLKVWIEGTNIRDLMNEFGDEANSPEDLGRIIDELFRKRLPWGMSGYIRIATKLLDIDRINLSELAKFFPSMVKFGMPDPVACWAMSLGIPFRHTAIQISSTFRDENNTVSYEKFLEWIGTLNNERLYHDFGLKGPILEDTTRAIFISSANPLFREFNTLDDFLPYEIYVRGIKYENRSTVSLRSQQGQRVELVRDYNNPIDRNAIAVNLSDQKMGYVPREVAQILAPEMDTGIKLRATIVSVEKRDIPKVMVRIEL
jgi:hypothetical protein